MTTAVHSHDALSADIDISRPPAWRWVHVAVAALAMAATLPGRTHGLGLITEPLLRDLNLGRVTYTTIGLWATLLGAAFCLPCGWLIDRLGVRVVLTTLLASLGGVVLLMTYIPHNPEPTAAAATVLAELFVMILLTRGLGQSALSVVSLALIGKSAGRRPGLPVGVYSFLVSIGFMAAYRTIQVVLERTDAESLGVATASSIGLAVTPLGCGPLGATSSFIASRGAVDWRPVWGGIGFALLASAVLSALLVRPSVSGWSNNAADMSRRASTIGLTLTQALLTPAFWVFSLAISFYGLIAAGTSLLGQSILRERGFELTVFLTITTVTPLIGLASNLATGWLATRWPLGRLLAISMMLLGAGLAAFPFVATLWQVYTYAAVMGVAGGMVTVLFFAVWGPSYGPAHLGKIQGSAQMITVLASAVGPVLLALTREHTGSYVLMFQLAAVTAAFFAVVAWLTPLPRTEGSHA
jgi:MFS family permease